MYFERIRDEVRDGKSLRVAAETGWIRARRTLLAADFVSLLGAVVLYILSIGSVRGFAFALGLTTVIDVLVAFTFTRPVVALLAATQVLPVRASAQRGRPEATGHPRSACAAIRGHRREEVAMSRLGALGHKLYSGEVSYDIVGKAQALVRDLRCHRPHRAALAVRSVA